MSNTPSITKDLDSDINITDDTAPSEKLPVLKIAVVLAVVLTAILDVLDSTIVTVALPHIRAGFGVTTTQVTWILTSYILAALMVMPLTGLFSRKFGRRRLITTAIIGFTVCSVLCGLSWGIEVMVLFRIGQGVFGAFLIPLSQSILFDCFPKEKRGQAMAVFGLGVIVAPILGPTIGGYLTETFSWRAVFYVNVPIAIVALVMMGNELKYDDTKDVKIDWYGLVLMMVSIAAFQLMLDEGVSDDWFSSRFIQISAFLAVIVGLFFVWRGWSHSNNILDLHLYKDRRFTTASFTMLGFGLGNFGTIAIIPIMLQGAFNYTVIDAGLIFIPRGIACAVAMVLCGSVLLKHFDGRFLIVIGLALTGLGNLMLSWLNLDASFSDVAWPGAVSGLGMGLYFVSIMDIAFQNIRQESQDEAAGIFNMTRSFGASIGIAIASWQYASRSQYHWNVLSENLPTTSPEVQQYLYNFNLTSGSAAGVDKLTEVMALQVNMLAFQDVFTVAAWGALLMIPFVFLMGKPKLNG